MLGPGQPLECETGLFKRNFKRLLYSIFIGCDFCHREYIQWCNVEDIYYVIILYYSMFVSHGFISIVNFHENCL